MIWRMARTCWVDGCSRPHYAKGYCSPHWRRWKRSGDPGPIAIQGKGRSGCAFEGCEIAHSAKGYCASHYAQYSRSGTVTELAVRVSSSARDPSGRKQCNACRSWLAIGEFSAQQSTSDKLAATCKRCARARVMSQRYGITIEDYEQLMAEQAGTCAICDDVNPGARELAVDHNRAHCDGNVSCGQCVRGLLCIRCNAGIGQFRDDPYLLRAAIAYLAGHA